MKTHRKIKAKEKPLKASLDNVRVYYYYVIKFAYFYFKYADG